MVVITSFRQPESPIKLELRGVQVILDKQDMGKGTLFVSERTLSWQKDGTDGFSIDYFNITLHAISNDPNVHKEQCVYVLTDCHIELPGQIPDPQAQGDGDSDAESEPDLSEIIFIPEESSMISVMYDAIKECQALNPDPVDVEDEEDENLYADAEEGIYMEEDESEEPQQQQNPEIDHLADRLQNNSVNVEQSNGNYGNDDEEFEDAD